MTRVHYLQHESFEGLGSIEPALRARGCRITGSHLYAGEALPELDGIDLLVVMGGGMSVNDEAVHPWLVAEKALIRQALQRGIAVLGVCLGAQLIASALGARVYPNTEREIGWFAVNAVAADSAGVFAFPSSQTVLHWHGETFDLPEGARLLASSPACRNQAFQLGDRCIGLQFHLEATPALVQGFVSHAAADLQQGGQWVQTAERIAEEPAATLQGCNRLLQALLDHLLAPR